jgi:WD40 repeat protein/HEAT repeat protein
MPIPVVCICARPYQIRDELAGQQVRCPVCGQVLTIPLPESPLANSHQPADGRQHGPRLSSDPNLVIDQPAPPQAHGNRAIAFLLAALVLGLGLGVAAIILLGGLSNPQSDQSADAQPPSSPTPPSPGTPEPGPPPAPPSTLPAGPWQGHTARIQSVSVSPDGQSVCSGSGGEEKKDGQKILATDCSIRQWDYATGKERQRLEDFPAGIEAIAFSPDGRLAAVAASGRIEDGVLVRGVDGDVHVWDLVARKEARVLRGHSRGVLAVVFSADGRRLLTAGLDNLVCVWEAASGNLLFSLEGHSAAVHAVALSADGRIGVTASADRTVRLWDLEKGVELRKLIDQAALLRAVALSPNGRVAATGGADMGEMPGPVVEILLWDVLSGKELRRLSGHTRTVHALTFAPDGARLLSGSGDNSVRLWQVGSGQQLKRYDAHSGAVVSLAVAADGRRAISGGVDGSLKVWELPPTVADLILALQDRNEANPQNLIRELGRMGPDAVQAVPALLQRLSAPGDDVRKEAIAALDRIGPPEPGQASRLLPLLADVSVPAGQRYALDALTVLGPETARQALVPLVDLLRDRDATLRRKAVVLLGQIGPAGRVWALTALIDRLRDSNAEVSQAAAVALGQLGPITRSDIPLLKKLLADATPAVRRFAVNSLTVLAREAAEATPGLLKLLEGEQTADLRRLALLALLKIDPKDRAFVEACNRSLDDEDPGVRRQAVGGLAKAGLDRGALGGLLRALQHSDVEVARTADEALAEVKLDKNHVPAVAAVLSRPATKVARMRLLDLLTPLGPEAAAALPGVRKVLKEATGDPQLKAIQAVAALGPAAQEAGADLAPLLFENDRKLKMEACIALAQIESALAEQAVPFLVRLMRVETPDDKVALEDRNRAGEALVKIGRPAAGRLIEALEEDFAAGNLATPQGQQNADARLAVVQVLGGIGGKVKAAEILLALAHVEARDKVPAIRTAAHQARIDMQKPKEK